MSNSGWAIMQELQIPNGYFQLWNMYLLEQGIDFHQLDRFTDGCLGRYGNGIWNHQRVNFHDMIPLGIKNEEWRMLIDD